MRTLAPHTAAIASLAALTLCLAGCSRPEPLPPVEESPLVSAAGTEAPAFSVRLPEILTLADIERETLGLDFADLEDASPLGGGWTLEPSLGQAWGTGERSRVHLTVMPPRDLELAFRCAPFDYPGSPRQRMTVSVNGEEIESLRLWNMMRSYSVEVPAATLRFGANRIEFTYAHAAVPAEVLPDSEDARRLAVLFEWIRLGEAAETLPVPAPSASADRTRLELPFGTRVSYYLELGEESRLRIGGVALDGAGAGGQDAWRLRLEAAVDGREGVDVVELGPEQLDGPLEMLLPTTETGQRARVALAAYAAPGRSEALEGLEIDLPEVISFDTELAERLAERREREAAAARTARGPNVLIYMIDTLRADHLGAYGYERPTSPRIDAFAAGATLFTHAIAQSPWTKPSVASVLTGLNPQLHGVNRRKDALAGEAVTLAEILWEAGYDTAAIFTNGNLSHMGLGQGYAHYQHLRERNTRDIHVLSDQLNDEAYRWLARRDRTKPFFLYLHSTDPHSPYTPRQEYLDRLGLEVADPDAGLIANVTSLRRGVVDPRERQDLVALYDAEIAFNDESFGELLDELARQDLLDDTLVVVVSDHGEEFYDHGWWQHGKTLYQEQLGVPLIVRFPDGEGAGLEIDSIAQQIDILPTVLDVVGLEIPDVLPGRSLRELVERRRWSSPPNAISYLDLDNRTAESVTSAIGKLVLHHYDLGQRELLFDLATDPAETVNLYDDRPVLAGYLQAALRAFHLAQQIQLTPERGEFDEELTERLKALGYLN